MSQKSYKNVTFTIDNEVTMGMLGKFTRTGNRDDNGYYRDRDIDKYTKFINSTDIDWQEAQLSNYEDPVENSGDVLNIINDLKSEINDLNENTHNEIFDSILELNMKIDQISILVDTLSEDVELLKTQINNE